MREPKQVPTTSEKLFRLAIALKGLDGGLQVVGALVLALLPASTLTGFAHAIIARDLLGDPGGTLARHLQATTENFVNGGTKTFAVLYLLAHGVIKLGLVFALARKIRPAYPIAIVVLAALVVYEIIRAVHTHSLALPFFAVLDVAITVVVLREYRQLRERPAVG